MTLADIGLYLTARKRSNGAMTVIWDGTQNPSEEIDNVGAYSRVYGDENVNTHDYAAMAQYNGATVLDVDNVYAAFGDVGSRVWAYTTRTLTASAAATTSTVSGSKITVTRGDSFSATLTGLGSIAARSKLWFTVKRSQDDPDSEAIIQIEATAGLLYVNRKAAGTTGNGSITIDEEDDGDITITLQEAETATLSKATDLYYDVQMLDTSGDVTTLTDGYLDVSLDVTRAIS